MDIKKKMKKFFTLTRKADGGFTLVELVVVIAILAILAGITVPAYGNYVENAKMATDQQTLATMNTAFTVACMDKGEYDMTALPFTPTASNLNTGVTVSHYNETFQGYFGGGAFQYYDVVQYSKAKGAFVVNTVAAIKEALKAAWDGTSFDEIQLNTILGQFDGIGKLFDDFSWTALNAYDDTVLEKLGLLGLSDITNEEAIAYLEANVDNWDSLTDEQKNEYIQNYKGNASVMQILSAAGDYDAEEIVTNIGNFVGLMGSIDEDDEEFKQGLIEYYNELHGYDEDDQGYTTDYDKAKLMLGVDGMLSGAQVYQLATSEMANSSGTATLGAMYALAMAYYKGEDGHDYGDFDTFQDAMSDGEGFLTYLGITIGDDDPVFDYANGQAIKDIEAYQSFAQYLSTGDINMEDASAFTKLLEYMNGALS